MKLPELSIELARQFQNIYGRAPRWIVGAPGRVNVIGEHTDYNDGFVLPMAIERYAVMAADLAPASASPAISVHDVQFNEAATIDVSKPVEKGVAEVVELRSRRGRGISAARRKNSRAGRRHDFNRSAGRRAFQQRGPRSLHGHPLETVTGKKMDPVDKALLCQKAEHEFAGVPCGIMDQFISVMGLEDHLLLLDCRSRKTELVPMSDPSVQLLIANTNVKHELGSGEYAKRRAQCEAAAKILGVSSLRDATADALEAAKGKMDAVVYRRARHVIGEIERTVHAAEGIRASNWPTVGQLMYASHASLRDDYEVSCKELDAIVEIAGGIGIKGGVWGCRMTGGGFGGCAVALVKTDAVDAISKQIAADYKARTGIEATIFVSRPASGATVIKG